MIKFFLVLTLFFGGVYYSLTMEETPEISKEDNFPKKKVKTVVEMANFLSEQEELNVPNPDKGQTQAQQEIKTNEENASRQIDERAVAAMMNNQMLPDPVDSIPLEAYQEENDSYREPSSEGETEEVKYSEREEN